MIGHRLRQHRGADAVDPDAARQLDRCGFHKTFNNVIDDGADHTARCVLIRENTRDQGKGALVGDERECCPDQIDLAHALGLDRVVPLLIGCLFERRWEDIARSTCYGFEEANFAEKRLQALGIGNIRLLITGLTTDRHDLVSLLLQRLLHSGPDGSCSNNDCFHVFLQFIVENPITSGIDSASILERAFYDAAINA